MASQSRAGKYLQEALVHLACRVFQSPPRLRVKLLEAGERGVEVGLVEELAAADPVTVDHQYADLTGLGFDALLPGRMRRVGDDRSEVRSADAQLRC